MELPCDPSLQAWSPELSLYDTNVTSPCPNTEGCTLTLRFLHPVVPHALTLWVTYISSSKCRSITTSYHQSGIADSLGCTIINSVGSRKSSGGMKSCQKLKTKKVRHQPQALQLLTEILGQTRCPSCLKAAGDVIH